MTIVLDDSYGNEMVGNGNQCLRKIRKNESLLTKTAFFGGFDPVCFVMGFDTVTGLSDCNP